MCLFFVQFLSFFGLHECKVTHNQTSHQNYQYIFCCLNLLVYRCLRKVVVHLRFLDFKKCGFGGLISCARSISVTPFVAAQHFQTGQGWRGHNHDNFALWLMCPSSPLPSDNRRIALDVTHHYSARRRPPSDTLLLTRYLTLFSISQSSARLM